VTSDGRIVCPFQHYLPESERDGLLTHGRNGVMISGDGGRTWSVHGSIGHPDPAAQGWAENTIAELSDGRIAMLIRADGTGRLQYAESTDGGVTWPEVSTPTDIPNPGSKVYLIGFGEGRVALIHNPDPTARRPMSVWVSDDGMRTWPHRRVLLADSLDGPGGRLAYPHGSVDDDGSTLHLVFDDNRHRGVYVRTQLPG